MKRTLSHRHWILLLAAFLSLVTTVGALQNASRQKEMQREEDIARYYQKWLNEDVVWIITPEERAVFEELSNSEERDQFIEQFWRSRDPDPLTAENEFREEHYRRIAYVNERYFAGVPGWKSDRGQIYIRFGPPDQMERYPAGGPYRRSASEGGGDANTFPFERWWYSHIEGVGDNVEIEFVDRSGTNEYRIALNANDKESFIQIDGMAMTQDEIDGVVSREDRLFYHPLGVDRDNLNVLQQDLPFQRLLRFAQVQKAPVIKNTRLQELVDSTVRYDTLPFSYRADWIRVGEQALVPLTLGFAERDLQFGPDGKGLQAAVDIFGRVKSLSGQIVSIFEHSIVKDRSGGGTGSTRALYQKMLLLDPGRYRLDLVVEDLHSGRVGIVQEGVTIPRIEEGPLASSPVILVDQAYPVDAVESTDMFVLGNQKIYPRLGDAVPPIPYLMFYVELYNVALDSATLTPDIDLTFQLVENGVVIDEKKDPGARGAIFQSAQRIALLEYLNLSKSQAESALIRIVAEDRVGGGRLTIEHPFRIHRSNPD